MTGGLQLRSIEVTKSRLERPEVVWRDNPLWCFVMDLAGLERVEKRLDLRHGIHSTADGSNLPVGMLHHGDIIYPTVA